MKEAVRLPARLSILSEESIQQYYLSWNGNYVLINAIKIDLSIDRGIIAPWIDTIIKVRQSQRSIETGRRRVEGIWSHALVHCDDLSRPWSSWLE